MTTGFDTAAAIGSGIGNAEAAWTFIRGFSHAWAAPLLTPAEVPSDAPLPEALRTAYRLLGDRRDLTSNQDTLLEPGACHWEGDVLVFRVENQSCASWGIRRADVTAPDPPVVFEAGADWRPFLPRTSLAVVEMVLSETLLRDDHLGNACELTEESQVTDRYERLRFPEYPSWADPDAAGVRWFSAPGRLLRLDGDWLFVRGQTEDHLRDLCVTVPGEWAQAQGTC